MGLACDLRYKPQRRMNTDMKTKQLKLVQAVRSWAHLPDRSQIAKPGALYLMRLRVRVGLPRPAVTPLTIRVNFKKAYENHAQPVNITHL